MHDGGNEWFRRTRRSSPSRLEGLPLVDILRVRRCPAEGWKPCPKKFPPEFKRDVVTIERRCDLTVAEVAADFDISPESVRRWMRQADIRCPRRPDYRRAGRRWCNCAATSGASRWRTRSSVEQRWGSPQRAPTAQRPWRAHAQRVRLGLDHPTPTGTRIAPGPLIGDPSKNSLPK